MISWAHGIGWNKNAGLEDGSQRYSGKARC